MLRKWDEQRNQAGEQDTLTGASKKRKTITQSAAGDEVLIIDMNSASETEGSAAAAPSRPRRLGSRLFRTEGSKG